jgi:putative ABC transport system substrate-binding protein
MRRRELINLLGTATVAWPISAQAQQSERPRRTGLLIPFPNSDEPQVKARLSAFKQHLHELGWVEGRNIQFDYRFTSQGADALHRAAQELIALGPDVIVAWGNAAVTIIREATQTIPIVFVGASDPVGSGFVTNIARPGENITGFQNFETAIGGKWLDVLKEIVPGVRRIGFMYSPDISATVEFLHTAEAASTSLGVAVTPVGVHIAADIEHALTALAKEPNSGLIVAPFPLV